MFLVWRNLYLCDALRLAFASRAFSCRWSRMGLCLFGLLSRGIVVVVLAGCGVVVGLDIGVRVGMVNEFG